MCVVTGGVAGPGSSGLGGVPVGGVVVVAEGLGDDGGGGLEDEPAQGGGERGAGGDAELAEQRVPVMIPAHRPLASSPKPPSGARPPGEPPPPRTPRPP